MYVVELWNHTTQNFQTIGSLEPHQGWLFGNTIIIMSCKSSLRSKLILKGLSQLGQTIVILQMYGVSEYVHVTRCCYGPESGY